MPDTTPKPFVFVLMPFATEFDDTYNLGIKAACKEAGAYCERVDEQIHNENILERIYNQIAKADIVVADLTGRNSNVFYETGYAHALGKCTILLTKNSADIPFDLKHYPHVCYEGKISTLKSELKKRIKHFMKNPEGRNPEGFKDLVYLIEGQNVRTEKSVTLKTYKNVSYGSFRRTKNWVIAFDIHNPTPNPVKLDGTQFGVVFPSEFGEPESPHASVSKINKSDIMYSCMSAENVIFPNGYYNWNLIFVKHDPALLFGKSLPCSVRIFGEFGTETIDFFIWVQEIPDPNTLRSSQELMAVPPSPPPQIPGL